MSQSPVTRRQVLVAASALTAATITGAGLAEGQNGAAPTPPTLKPRLTPRADLVNVLEYEAEAARVLPAVHRTSLTGSDRALFDRITLRPRMNIPTTDLDLTVTLFGEPHFTPIIVGPIASRTDFHPDGDTATILGAGAARTAVVITVGTNTAVESMVSQAKSQVWAQVFAADPAAAAKAESAIRAGTKALVVTLSTAPTGSVAKPSSPTAAQWAAVQALARAMAVPVIAKGVSSIEHAKRAIDAGVKGLVASAYGQPTSAGNDLLLRLPAIVDTVGGAVPVFADGGFRRGTDIVKALAFGARAVFVGRPVMWGLAAYGAEGVQGVLEMLQAETARYMAMCGRPSLATLSRDMLRVHARRVAAAARPAGAR
jgi:isopentenyl diphosphate isomerase/L-lactate dehydrogenase-like FMN-dependent dehydrogenase